MVDAEANGLMPRTHIKMNLMHAFVSMFSLVLLSDDYSSFKMEVLAL